MRLTSPITAVAVAALSIAAYACATGRGGGSQPTGTPATPIKHLVIIFDENISFDHYFGVYPRATNPPGEPSFTAAANTPSVNGLRGDLLTNNPNARNSENEAGATNPFRLDRTQAATSDQSHAYTAEQRAYHDGRADLFPKYTGHAGSGGAGAFGTKGIVMGYFDGNTVTAMWNYAQHFAMSDNAYGDQYGPSTPGALALVSGQTNGFWLNAERTAAAVPDGQGGMTVINDPDPGRDTCSSPGSKAAEVMMTGRNIGDLLNEAGVSWGWFQGGFDISVKNANGSTGCRRTTYSEVTKFDVTDFVPHHEPFQYYASTANPTHARPTSMAVVGTAADNVANHQYDTRDFFAAVSSGNFPAVSFLKPPAYENGHAGNSDPLDEQRFVVEVINFLQQQPAWRETAVIIAYDDSDGWYDHQMAPVANASFDSIADQVSGPGACGVRGRTPQLGGVKTNKPVNGRCGPGARQPFLIVSPWSRVNYVDHTQIIQSSIIHFIEDNWLGGKRIGGGSFDAGAGSILGLFDFSHQPHLETLYLDPEMGTVLSAPPPDIQGDKMGRFVAVALLLGASCDSAPHDGGVANPHPVRLVRPAPTPLSAMALLGREIFFDSALSSSGRRSCASCHRPDHAYAADRLTSVPRADILRAVPSLRYADRAPAFGVGPELSDVDDSAALTPRATSAQRIKVADASHPDALVARGGLFWDGRVNTLQDQAMGPLFNPNEMGNRDVLSVSDRLHHASYARQFVTLFGANIFAQPDRLVDEAMFAVARYQIEDASFHPYDSKYDAYLEGRAALTASEWRGLQAFEDPKRGNCAACHLDRARGDGLPPVFTDYEYEALGVPVDTTRKTAAADLGACGPLRIDLKTQPEYCGKFRTPSLRNTATRTAFFHNGVFSTLDDVVAFYNFRDTRPEMVYHGAPLADRRNLDTVDAPFNRRRGQQPPMTDQEMRDVVAFLRTLTDGYVVPRP